MTTIYVRSKEGQARWREGHITGDSTLVEMWQSMLDLELPPSWVAKCEHWSPQNPRVALQVARCIWPNADIACVPELPDYKPGRVY